MPRHLTLKHLLNLFIAPLSLSVATHHGLYDRHVSWQGLQALQVVQVEAEDNPVDLGTEVDLKDGGLHKVVVLLEV
jgi:hypothetical protein